MTKENGVVAVPKTYFFKMAKLDYTSWEKALPREFLQNSVDAGASVVKIDVDEERRTITVSDNGCGMDYDTIKEKLLVLGGSKKDKGSIGAFGKAKEILFFSWESYWIRTQDWRVTGEGAKYSIEQVKTWQKGTTCCIKVWKSEDLRSLRSSFEIVASYFQVDCALELNGDPIKTHLKRGELLRSMDWADVYLDKGVHSYHACVRISGQWMFDEWMSNMYEFGKIVLEVHGDSLEVLTSNRDSLKGEYARKFRKLMAEFATETKSALEPTRVIVRERFTGTGKVAVDSEKMEKKMREYLVGLSTRADRDEVIDGVIDRLPEENLTSVDIDRVTETVERMTGNVWDHEDRFKFIGFQPDFHLIYDKKQKGKSTIDRFMRGSNAGKLANAWAEVLKQVLLDIESYIEFNVGFNFSITSTASYEMIDGEPYFYLNPQLLLSDCEGSPKWYSTSKSFLREDLILKAIHEIGHHQKESHNEDFILHIEWIRARTWKSLSIYPKIIKECFRK